MSTVIQADFAPSAAAPNGGAPRLLALLQDGISLVAILRQGARATEPASFATEILTLLQEYERHARNFGKNVEDIENGKYAFCALLDEVIMTSVPEMRSMWEREPLQLRLFGEHLAGEGFFLRLDKLRLTPEKHLEALEVFHYALLLGFRGRYLLEGSERLEYLIAQLGREISHLRGQAPAFAPHAGLPARIAEAVRELMPVSVLMAGLLFLVVAVFTVYHVWLGSETDALHPPATDTPATPENSATGADAPTGSPSAPAATDTSVRPVVMRYAGNAGNADGLTFAQHAECNA